MTGASLHTLIPSNSPLSSAPLIKLDNPSATQRNKYGDKGSPFLRPLVGEKKSVSIEINMTL
jgi:hypothetical protein